MKHRIVTVTEFKAKCHELLDRVRLTGEHIQVTKRGKITAEVVPWAEGGAPEKPGFARDSMWILGDIMEPLDVEWEALK